MTEQYEWKLRFIHGKVMADSHDKDGKYLKTLFADEIESRLNEYETLEQTSADLLEALRRARAELVDPNRGPSGPKPTIAAIDEAIRKAEEK